MVKSEYLKAEKDINGNWALTKDVYRDGYRFVNLILNGKEANRNERPKKN